MSQVACRADEYLFLRRCRVGQMPIMVETASGPMWGATVGTSNDGYEIHIGVPVMVVGTVAVRPFASGGRGKRFLTFF